MNRREKGINLITSKKPKPRVTFLNTIPKAPSNRFIKLYRDLLKAKGVST